MFSSTRNIAASVLAVAAGDARWDARMAAWLLWVARQPGALWRSYMALLPTQQDMTCLLNFSPAEAAELQLPSLVVSLSFGRLYMDDCCVYVCMLNHLTDLEPEESLHTHQTQSAAFYMQVPGPLLYGSTLNAAPILAMQVTRHEFSGRPYYLWCPGAMYMSVSCVAGGGAGAGWLEHSPACQIL